MIKGIFYFGGKSMMIKKLDFIDVELEETIKGYMIIDEEEIIIFFEGYQRQEYKKFKNIEEIAQELIHTREKLAITEEMLDEEIKKNEDYEEILNDIFEN